MDLSNSSIGSIDSIKNVIVADLLQSEVAGEETFKDFILPTSQFNFDMPRGRNKAIK